MGRNSQCAGKVRHATRWGAEIAVRKSGNWSGDLTLQSYRCKKCSGYHVGHPYKSVQKQLHFTRIINLIDKAMQQGRHT